MEKRKACRLRGKTADAGASPVGREHLAHALPDSSSAGAAAGNAPKRAMGVLMEAMDRATIALGDEEVTPGLNAAQVLADSATRQSATRWRSGPESKRLTALMARFSEGLQSLFPGRADASARPVLQPVQAVPLRAAGQTGPVQLPAGSFSGRAWMWISKCMSWKTLGFPRLVAFALMLGVRVLAQLLLRLTGRLLREMLSQVTLLAADMETQVIDWLYQLWMDSPATVEVWMTGSAAPVPSTIPAASASTSAPAWTSSSPSSQAVTISLPTRPVDYLTLFLLLLQTLRSFPRGWGGWARPQLG